MLDLARQILVLMKSKLRPDVRNEASNEIARLWLSCRKAREKLGWKLKHDLKHGLNETTSWYKANLK